MSLPNVFATVGPRRVSSAVSASPMPSREEVPVARLTCGAVYDCAGAKTASVKRLILIYGACGGLLIAILQLVEYRFLVIEHSLEIYGALVAAIFAGVGIWLGLKLTRKERVVVVREVPVPATEPFTLNQEKLGDLGITPRELEILELIAQGLSNREIAERLFVSENTVKTHSSRLFEKLSAKRRTQAVQIGKALGLIP
jgi:DNA-binding CsgD family transcriptional regulator